MSGSLVAYCAIVGVLLDGALLMVWGAAHHVPLHALVGTFLVFFAAAILIFVSITG